MKEILRGNVNESEFHNHAYNIFSSDNVKESAWTRVDQAYPSVTPTSATCLMGNQALKSWLPHLWGISFNGIHPRRLLWELRLCRWSTVLGTQMFNKCCFTKITNSTFKTYVTKPVVPTEEGRCWSEDFRLIKRLFF